MVPVVILTVCEGSTDHTIIQLVAEHMGARQGVSIEIRPLEPEFDATSGRTKRNGWTGVRRWCRRAADDISQRGADKIGQILALSGARGIIIQIDADAAPYIAREEGDYGAALSDPDILVEKAVNNWLGPALSDNEIRITVTKMQTETWILATYDIDENQARFDYEGCIDVEKRLIEMGYTVDHNKPGRIYKDIPTYLRDIQYGLRLVSHLELARQRCKRLFQDD